MMHLYLAHLHDGRSPSNESSARFICDERKLSFIFVACYVGTYISQKITDGEEHGSVVEAKNHRISEKRFTKIRLIMHDEFT